jgi:hypothetical protein
MRDKNQFLFEFDQNGKKTVSVNGSFVMGIHSDGGKTTIITKTLKTVITNENIETTENDTGKNRTFSNNSEGMIGYGKFLSENGYCLAEMGDNFCYIGNQFRLDVGGSEFFVDLLLYDRKLKCLVAIELKVGETTA